MAVPYALLALLASSIALAGRSPVYTAAFAAQCLLYLLAGYGAWLDRHGAVDARVHAPGVAASWPAPPSRERANGALNA